jgi:hypothetical protein
MLKYLKKNFTARAFSGLGISIHAAETAVD